MAEQLRPQALPKKAYKLTFGTHRDPNPDFHPDSVMMPEMSHVVRNVGDIVMLTDDQYRAFKDRFTPADEGATSTADADKEVLENAKKVAAATGEMVDPNKSLPTPSNPHQEGQHTAAQQTGTKKN
jgi:hypothetical protein